MMFLRNEKKYCRLYGIPFQVNEVREITEDQAKEISSLIDRGDFSLHSTDPSKPKKPRRRRKKKATDE